MEAVGGSGAGVIKNVDRGDCDRWVMVPFRFIKMRVGNLVVFHKERSERLAVLLYLGG